MAYKEQDRLPAKIKPRYSDHELYVFDQNLEKYRSKNDGIPRMDWDQFYLDEGVETKKGVICRSIQKDKYGEIISADIPMNDLLEKIVQWEDWTRRKNFISGKRPEGLGKRIRKLATSKVIEKEFVSYDKDETNDEHAENDLERIARIRKEGDF